MHPGINKQINIYIYIYTHTHIIYIYICIYIYIYLHSDCMRELRSGLLIPGVLGSLESAEPPGFADLNPKPLNPPNPRHSKVSTLKALMGRSLSQGPFLGPPSIVRVS